MPSIDHDPLSGLAVRVNPRYATKPGDRAHCVPADMLAYQRRLAETLTGTDKAQCLGWCAREEARRAKRAAKQGSVA